MGVQEWRIPFPPGEYRRLNVCIAPNVLVAPGQHPTFSQPWALYDVGGARTQRRAWLPFFDGVNAIIFLARKWFVLRFSGRSIAFSPFISSASLLFSQADILH